MVENITEELETVENPNEFVFPKLTFTEDEYNQTLDIFRGAGGGQDPVPNFVKTITNELSLDYPDDPNFVSEKALKDGTATIFNFIPNLSTLPPKERRLSNEQIVRLLVQDTEGRPATEGSLIRGFGRKAPTGAASAVAFLKGAQAANVALSGVPPVGPGAVARIAGPLITGTAAAMATTSGGDFITEKFFGPRRLLVPGTDSSEVAGEIFGENIFFGGVPFFIKEKTSRLGTDLIVDNLKGRRSAKITKGLEEIIDRARIEAQTKKGRFATSELGATAAGALAVGQMDPELREDTLNRLTVETTATVGAGLVTDFLAKRVIDAGGFLFNKYKKLKKEGFKGFTKSASEKNEELVGEFLRDFLESRGENITEVLENLDDTTLEVLAARIRSADPTQQIEVPQLTAGSKARSPGLLSLEKSLQVGGSGLEGERITGNTQAIELVKKGILLLHATDDKGAVKEANELIKEAFELDLNLQVNNAQKNLQAAFEKLQKGEGGDERIAELGEKLFEVIDTSLKTARAKERYLWQNVVGDTEINTFTDINGNQTNTPNFVNIWKEILRETPEANIDNEKALRSLILFTERKTKELGLGGSIGSTKAQLNFRKVLAEFMESPEATQRGSASLNLFNVEVNRAVQDAIGDFTGSADDAIKNMNVEQLNSVIASLSTSEISSRGARRGKVNPRVKLISAKRKELIERKNNLTSLETTADPTQGVSARELIDMRSKALSLGTTLQSQGDKDGASAAFAFASALLRDLESFPEGSNLEYDIARGYSKALNDTFTRTYGGKVLDITKTGAARVEPELLGRELFQVNKAFLRVKQLDNMGKFGLEQDLTSLLSTNKERGQELIAEARKVAFNEQYGVFDIPKLEAWLQSNKDELSTMPAILTRFDETTKRMIPYEAEGGLYSSLKNTVDATKDLRNTGESILRKIEAETFKADGTASRDAIQKWMKQESNKDLLEIFPEIKADLDALIAGDDSKLIMFERAKEAKKNLIANKRKFSSFYDLIGDSKMSPTSAVIRAITNKDNPVRELTGLFEAIEKAPNSWSNPQTGDTFTKEEALEGFRNSVLDAVITSSSSRGAVNGPLLYRNMFAGLGGSQNNISLAKFLENKEVFSEAHIKAIESLMARLMDLDTAAASGNIENADSIMSKVGVGTDIMISTLGSSGASRLYALVGGEGPGTLIMAGRGAKLAREKYQKIFKDMPDSLKSDYLKTVLASPTETAKLIRRAKTAKEEARLLKSIYDFAVDNYFVPPARRTLQTIATTPVEDFIPEEEPVVQPTVPRLQDPTKRGFRPNRVSDASPSMNAVRPAPPPVAQASPPPTSPAPSDPQTRQKYAALFPNDPTSAMIRGGQGGIGSLFG
jgi:hypothetical protein